MPSEYSLGLLAVFLPLIVVLAIQVPPYAMLLLTLATVLYPAGWQIASVHIDIVDLMLAGIALSLLVVHPGMLRQARRRKLPYAGLWIALGVLQSAAYLAAPLNQEHLTSPVAAAYQLYRYCWRPILFFPLAVWLIDDRRKLEHAMIAIVAIGGACAFMAFRQGFSGDEATGPFVTKNILGGALITPFILAVSAALYTRGRWSWRFYAASILLIGRGFLFAGSRGAFVAVLGGLAWFFGQLFLSRQGRSKALRFALAGGALGLLVIAAKPDVFERPTVKHILTASEGMEEANMQWRMQERWPHFWRIATDNFWLGTGTDVDPTFEECPTPHNGYLGVALISGFPSLIALTGLALLGIGNGVHAFRRGRDEWQRQVGLALSAAIIGIIIHNLVDETFRLPFAMNALWLLTAATAMLARRASAFLPAPAPAAQTVRGTATIRLRVAGAGQ